MTEHEQKHPVLINLLATAAVTATVIVALILNGAPTWGWEGIGLIVWLQQVNLSAQR